MKTKIFEYEGLHATVWHQHESGQLYWLSHGIIVIETELAQWAVTPGSVGWFPAHLLHRAWAPGSVKGHCLYLEPSSSVPFPPKAGIYGADAFVLVLLERICRSGHLSSSMDYLDTLLKVLGYEIAQLTELPLQLTLPEDRRARNVANELLKNPGCVLNQTQLAQQWGLSVRNLSRLFTQQTGLSFSQWRQQAKVVSSLQWVLAGLPVSEVASLSGYSNVSAYIEIFRQRFGKTPGQFKAH
ncbi:transcriptional regulator [Chania multitudinisentens RB-25]|uniref:Transcriptional regulator n=1 Tax=Chania multitudinisentens RB-25 TaxID=1441930 RepID=W0L946_9GAMM|nr:AraC family transcriptional regulator [Chania multitudinisentens]AHG18879.2 transcriptional regulator [Chania multitudinisentens RB-25]